jgi:hypothetical protein
MGNRREEEVQVVRDGWQKIKVMGPGKVPMPRWTHGMVTKPTLNPSRLGDLVYAQHSTRPKCPLPR